MSKFKVGDRVVDAVVVVGTRGTVFSVRDGKIQLKWDEGHENPATNNFWNEEDFVLESEYDAPKEEKKTRITHSDVFHFQGDTYGFTLKKGAYLEFGGKHLMLRSHEFEEFIEFLKLGLK